MATKNLKLPPQDIEAEKSVLGGLMLDKNAIVRVADLLEVQDFYQPAHQKIYSAALELFSASEPIDILTITSRLKHKKELDDIGGSSYLTGLINAVPSTAHLGHYAKIVHQKKTLRDLLNASAEITEQVFDSADNAESLLDRIEQKIFSISQKSITSSYVFLKETLGEAYERIEKINLGKEKLRGITSGFAEIDNYLSGFQPSDLVILGARPSMGKTSLMLDFARNGARSGSAVAIFSLEMSREQIIDRLIASESGVDLWKLRTGRLDDMEFSMIREALDKLSKMNIIIDDTPSPSILQIRSIARRLQIEHDLKLLVIDYVQLISTENFSTDNMVQQFTEISHGLKSLARELDIPVLALSQLSRGVDQREVKIPRLSDLRETGSWEQDADVVMFIYRKDKDKLNPSPEEINTAEIIIAKHRNGPVGSVSLKFDPERACFKSIDRLHEPLHSQAF